MDFDTKEPYIQFKLEIDPSDPDNNDETLKHFIEQANNRGLVVQYPSYNSDNSSPQLRLAGTLPALDNAFVLDEFVKFFLNNHEDLINSDRNQVAGIARMLVEALGGNFELVKQ